MKRDQRVEILLEELPVLYPDARCLLEYAGKPERLLISTILSARTTDAAVNEVAPALWSSVSDIRGLANAQKTEIEAIVHPLHNQYVQYAEKSESRREVFFGRRI